MAQDPEKEAEELMEQRRRRYIEQWIARNEEGPLGPNFVRSHSVWSDEPDNDDWDLESNMTFRWSS
jgi:hypothetical protein